MNGIVQWWGLGILLISAGIAFSLHRRRLRETARRTQPHRLQAVFDHSPDALILLDDTGTCVQFNPAAGQLPGTKTSPETFPKLWTLFPEADSPFAESRWPYLRDQGTQNGEFVSAPSPPASKTWEFHFQPNLLPQLHLLMMRDISERHRLEERRHQAQKMEAVGQLASGLAHDFNNLLTVVNGHVGLLQSDGELSPTALEWLGEIQGATQRAAALTRQLLVFGRRQVLRKRRLDLNQLIDNLAPLLRKLLGDNIKLTLLPCPEAPILEADAGMIEQVLVNLSTNARDAMPQGGQLQIRTRLVDHPGSPTNPPELQNPGRYVQLAVIDQGVGMKPEIQSHLFEPFFTTKEVGKGTGLGLATIYGIVLQHQGWLEVESQDGHGTTFLIHLPYRPSPPLANPAEPPPADHIPQGKETILIVEDEPVLRQLLRKTLTRCGYQVQEAEDGQTALRLWRQHRESIDLVLTDLMMPKGISGRELVERLKADKPSLKVIFSSGYSLELNDQDLANPTHAVFLPKPYETTTLTQTVRQCLDAPS